MNVVVDTSVWVDFFRGQALPQLEKALEEARVYVTPLIVSELISGARTKKEEKQLLNFLDNLPCVEMDFAHWVEVGRLRQKCLKKGLAISTPDTHIAHAASAVSASLMAKDKIFSMIARLAGIKVVTG